MCSWSLALARVLDAIQPVRQGISLEDALGAQCRALQDRGGRVTGELATHVQFGLGVLDLGLQVGGVLIDLLLGDLVGFLSAGCQGACQGQRLLDDVCEGHFGYQPLSQGENDTLFALVTEPESVRLGHGEEPWSSGGASK